MATEERLVRKCDECGWLAFRTKGDRTGVPHLAETDQEMRQSDFRRFPDTLFEFKPVCFSRNQLFREDIEALGDRPAPEQYAELIHQERFCDDFTDWQQGFSPKEHRETLDRERLGEFQTKREDDWQKFQIQMAEDDKKWREDQEYKAEQRHQSQLTTMRGIHKVEMLVMGLFVTNIVVISTLLGGAMQANWVPKWFGIGQENMGQPFTPASTDNQDSRPSDIP